MADVKALPFPMVRREQGMHEELDNLLRRLNRQQIENIIPRDNVQHYYHSDRWSDIVDNGRSVATGQAETHSVEHEVSLDKVQAIDFGLVEEWLQTFLVGLEGQLYTTLYGTVSAAAEQAGNVERKANDESIADTFLKSLERIEFGVDREGRVTLPELHMPPELIEQLQRDLLSKGPEFHARIEEVKRRKAREALDKDRERRAKFMGVGSDG